MLIFSERVLKEITIIGKQIKSYLAYDHSKDDKPLITDGALNVLPNVKTKIHILRNVINFPIELEFQDQK